MVDPLKYIEFKSYFEDYFKLVIQDKCQRLFEFLHRKIENTVIKNFKKLKNNDRDIFFELHQIDVPRRRKNLRLCDLNFFNCFAKKKQSKHIHTSINFEKFKYDFDSYIQSVSNTFMNIYSQQLIIKDFNMLVYELYLCKLSTMYKSNFENKLKEIVDKFYLFFNIEQIIAKQIGEINKQKLKLENLEELKESLLCIVCCENYREVIFYPCKHLLCCSDCLVNECPTCNNAIEKKLIISN